MSFPRHIVESTFKEVIEKASIVRRQGHLLMYGRCPICHEGKSKTKKRFYLYEADGIFKVFCHNGDCNYSKSFNNFLKEKFPDKYDYLTFECFKSLNKENMFDSQESPIDQKEELLPSHKIHLFLKDYFSYSCLPLTIEQENEKKEKLRKYALHILIDRNIPEDFVKKCFVCFRGAFQWRIIIPFINDKGLYYNFQARDIHPRPSEERKNKKYVFANFDGKVELPDDKIFNRYSVDASKTVYIFEGIFKSLYVKNSIALCNANVVGHRADEIRKSFSKRIWVLDNPWNDNTGREAILKLLKMGESCFIMPPEHSECKDMDELAKKLKVQEIDEEYIKKNVYNGSQLQERDLGIMRLKLMEMNINVPRN